jgi:hypothetical protein
MARIRAGAPVLLAGSGVRAAVPQVLVEAAAIHVGAPVLA